MLWLLYQSDDLEKLFSENEIIEVEKKIIYFRDIIPEIKQLFDTQINGKNNSSEKLISNTVKKMFESSIGQGFKLLYSGSVISDSIFIESSFMMENVQDRIDDAIRTLEENGHTCQMKSSDGSNLVYVDNVLYSFIPDAIRVRYINLHGIRLQKVTL